MEVIIREKKREKEKQEERKKFWKGVRDKKRKEKFRDKLGKVERCEEEMETEGKKLKERIRITIKEMKKRRTRKKGGMKNAGETKRKS